MKKLFALPLVFLILCGCTNKKTVTPILQNISFNAVVSYGDNDFSCNTKLTEDSLTLVLNEPKEIKGLTLCFSKNGVVAEYHGIKYERDSLTQTDAAPSQFLYGIINDIKSQNCSIQHTNENCFAEGKLQGNKYIFEFSPTGLPISLKIDELDLKIDFKNVTLN